MARGEKKIYQSDGEGEPVQISVEIRDSVTKHPITTAILGYLDPEKPGHFIHSSKAVTFSWIDPYVEVVIEEEHGGESIVQCVPIRLQSRDMENLPEIFVSEITEEAR